MMKYEQLLQQIFYRYGNYIQKINGKLGVFFLILAVGFLLYALTYRKEKQKKTLGLNGWTFFLVSGILSLLYPAKLTFGQLWLTFLGK